nr:MAG TPA: Carcinustatin peptide [Caudoviricetes sp.]
METGAGDYSFGLFFLGLPPFLPFAALAGFFHFVFGKLRFFCPQ